MKQLLIATLLFITTGCATVLVEQSDVVVTTPDEQVIYVKATETGQLVYDNWSKGLWGDTSTVLILLDTVEYNNLYEKSYISKRRNKRR